MSEFDLAIVTPIWRDIPDQIEIARIEYSLNKNPDFHHYFIAPERLDSQFYSKRFPQSHILFFDSKFFESIQSYNLFMLSPDIYRAFIKYRQILILQLDAILVNSILIDDLLDFDYIGAPWKIEPRVFRFGSYLSINTHLSKLLGVKVPVGNGGLSIRNPTKFMECFYKKDIKGILWNIIIRGPDIPNEDVIWSYLHTVNKSKLPSAEIASRMFLESGASLINEVPIKLIGFHDLETYNLQLERRILNHGI